MKIYIINLERSEKRRQHIIAEAKKHNLEYELFSAVDGLYVSDSEKKELCDLDAIANKPDLLSPGMIGCALSHYKLYRKIIEDGVEVALILEDDVILADGFSKLLTSIEKRISGNEIIALHYVSIAPSMLSNYDRTELPDNYSLRYPVDIRQLNSTAAFLITRQAAMTLSEAVLPIRAAPDSWGYFYECGGFDSFRCVYPSPIRISPAQSDIHSFKNARGRIVRSIENWNIPGLVQMIKYFRTCNILRISQAALVDKRSPLAIADKS